MEFLSTIFYAFIFFFSTFLIGKVISSISRFFTKKQSRSDWDEVDTLSFFTGLVLTIIVFGIVFGFPKSSDEPEDIEEFNSVRGLD